MQPPTAPHCIATKRKKPHKSLCGLGSWREQQQTIERNQKFACCQARPHRNLWGFVFRSSPDATQTVWIIHKNSLCQQVFLDFLIVCYATSEIWIATIQSSSLSSHHSVLCRRKDAFSVPDVKRV
jgi:hypothetical protein